MADREKVIKGLTICYKTPAKCEDCPYHDLPIEQNCNDVLCLDALALLKEQECIVRCKDCYYYQDYDGGKICTGLGEWYGRVPEDYFCADGKRR